MPTIPRRVVFALLLGLSASCHGQATSKSDRRTLTTTEMSGGRVVTDLAYGIQVNKGSDLQRRWFVVNDESCPMQLREMGVSTTFTRSSIGGDYKYVGIGSASLREAIVAYDIRFLLFDVWGEHVKTLQAQKITEMHGELARSDIASWTAWESDVSELLTVVSFVARVRRPDGSIWTYDPAGLLREVEKIKVRLSENELLPDPEKAKK